MSRPLCPYAALPFYMPRAGPGGYSYEYSFTRGEAGTIDGFAVEVRPERYGIAGIRSYLAVGTIDSPTRHNTLNVYATPQDRPATTNDPLALGSKIGLLRRSSLATTGNYPAANKPLTADVVQMVLDGPV